MTLDRKALDAALITYHASEGRVDGAVEAAIRSYLSTLSEPPAAREPCPRCDGRGVLRSSEPMEATVVCDRCNGERFAPLSEPPAALAWHELATADPLTRAKAWDRCYPGNVNIERLVDDLVARVARLEAALNKCTTVHAGSAFANPTVEQLLTHIAFLEGELRRIDGNARAALSTEAKAQGGEHD